MNDMNIQDIIQRIGAEDEKENIIRPVMTLPLLKFELINYLYDTYTPAGVTQSGYYTFENNQAVWHSDPDWRTVNVPVSVSGRTICNYHGKITRDIVFIIVTGITATYCHVSGKEDNPLYDVTFAVPENTTVVTASYYNNPVFTDFNLKVRREQYTDITRYVKNWDDLDIKLSRDGFNAVMLEISTPIELSGYAGDLVRKLIEDNGLYAETGVNIYKRNDYGDTYNLLRRFEADFLSYEEYDDYVEFGLTNNALQDVIKSGKSTKFDYPVSSLTEIKKWNYANRMVLLNNIPYTLPLTEEPIDNPYDASIWPMYLPASLGNAEVVQRDDNVGMDYKSQSFEPKNSDNIKYIFKPGKELGGLILSVKFSIKAEVVNLNNETRPCYLNISKASMSSNDTDYPMISKSVEVPANTTMVVQFDVDETATGSLNSDERLIFYLDMQSVTPSSRSHIHWIQYLSFDHFGIKWMDTGDAVNNIDLIRPAALLQRLLDSVSPIKNKYTSRIEWSETFTPMLCAAETIREFPEAALHGSLSDFMKWMEVLGYSYTFEDDALVYKRRYQFYKYWTSTLNLKENEVSGLKTEVNNDVAYNVVETGYKKEDYNESANGKLEVNATFNYNTGYINPEGKTLSLISPYRSDSIGVEVLLNKRGEKIKDDQSDNDIFALQMDEATNSYIYSEENKIKVESESYDIYLYNGSLCPYLLASRNQDLAGIITKRLMFASTDGYRKGTIDGKSIFTDIDIIAKGLYAPFTYSFNVGSHLDIPDENVRDGLVFFEYKGVQRMGYIKNITKSVPEKEGEWELFMYK
jgi:hypothetical protein